MEQAASAFQITAGATAPAKILVCEDELLFALDLERRLTSLGYEVLGIASDPEEAIAIAERVKPDVALMDMRLKNGALGADIAKILERDFDVPSIYLTAYADEETLAKAATTNPLGYLVKPVQDLDLKLAIRFGLSQHRGKITLRKELKDSAERFKTAQANIENFGSSLANEARMAGLQDLIGGISHHFNNSLAALLPSLELLRDGGTLQPFELRQIQQLIRMCEAQKSFVQRLTWASGRGGFRLAAHSLQLLVSKAIAQGGLGMPTGIRLSKQLPPESWSVFVDEDAFTHSLANVIQNSIEAMDGSGVLTITVSESYEELPTKFNSRASSGWYFVVTVKDNGPGIPPEEVEKVTAPFYTTKVKRVASGLGLSEAYGVAQGHGGWLDVSSMPGNGTTVRFFLPEGSAADGSKPNRPKPGNTLAKSVMFLV